MAAENPEDIGAVTRRRVRDVLADGRILQRCVADIHTLLFDVEDCDLPDVDVVHIWDEKAGSVPSGKSYGTNDDITSGAENVGYGTIVDEQ